MVSGRRAGWSAGFPECVRHAAPAAWSASACRIAGSAAAGWFCAAAGRCGRPGFEPDEQGGWRLRRNQASTPRPFRFAGGRPLALAFMVLFGLLAVISSVTVGAHTSIAPLVLLAVVAGLVTLYVFTYVPRLERREAEELAARRAARAAARTAQAAKGATP